MATKFRTAFYGEVRDGQPTCLYDFLRSCKLLEGKRIAVTLEERARRRSLSQNAYYHGVVVLMITEAMRDLGNDICTEEAHQFLKTEVGKLEHIIFLPDGSIKRGPGSTARLTTIQFENYLEKCRAWAAEMLSIEIPLPNETL